MRGWVRHPLAQRLRDEGLETACRRPELMLPSRMRIEERDEKPPQQISIESFSDLETKVWERPAGDRARCFHGESALNNEICEGVLTPSRSPPSPRTAGDRMRCFHLECE